MISSQEKEAKPGHDRQLPLEFPGGIGGAAIASMAVSSERISQDSELGELSLSVTLLGKLNRAGITTIAQVRTLAYEQQHISGITQNDVYDLYDAMTDLDQREQGDSNNWEILEKRMFIPRKIEVHLEAELPPDEVNLQIMFWIRRVLKHTSFHDIDPLEVLTAAYALKHERHHEILNRLFDGPLAQFYKPAQRVRVHKLIDIYEQVSFARWEDEKLLVEGVTLGLMDSTHSQERYDEIKGNMKYVTFHPYGMTQFRRLAQDWAE